MECTSYYTTLDLSTFFWKKSQILFSCYGINATLKGRYRDPPVDIWGAENMPFPSRDWIFYMIVSVQLCTTIKNLG